MIFDIDNVRTLLHNKVSQLNSFQIHPSAIKFKFGERRRDENAANCVDSGADFEDSQIARWPNAHSGDDEPVGLCWVQVRSDCLFHPTMLPKISENHFLRQSSIRTFPHVPDFELLSGSTTNISRYPYIAHSISHQLSIIVCLWVLVYFSLTALLICSAKSNKSKKNRGYN